MEIGEIKIVAYFSPLYYAASAEDYHLVRNLGRDVFRHIVVALVMRAIMAAKML